ncbi:sensor histidine kinase [Oceanicella actignis]|uniref:sensor histidine kinase n=1 Tax=Oceanicella actignis TaxID=1189325 RepID=UPI0011E85C7E|nr:stimulus-sensing domain-containing protein [Oceanicella actignis]TYO88138.1 two-component system sensor histidine kinase ChvG [Oceanicella actignis]
MAARAGAASNARRIPGRILSRLRARAGGARVAENGGARVGSGIDPAAAPRAGTGVARPGRVGRIGRLSPLTRRIVAFNLIGLGLLVTGVLALNDFREKLIALRTDALETQGRIIAITIAESAARDDALGIDPARAMIVLDKLIEPTHVRAQIFDRAARLMRDTSLRTRRDDSVEASPLPADRLDAPAPAAWLQSLTRRVRAMLYRDARLDTRTLGGVAREREVYAALGGAVARGERINEKGELIVSVSVPITRLKAVLGVLVLSTRGGDIDEIVRSERMSILQVFLVALAASVVMSALLANTIARPIRLLARSAEAAEQGGAGGGAERVEIPDMTARMDEIGYLSGALKRMTEALYSRIDATETFAADVAHEIKNPLTSLRSAVETMRLTDRPEARERLLQVIEHDVARLDRLVTDISNASRLDAELVREAREPFDLNALLRSIVEHNAPKAAERGARIVLDAPPAPAMVRGIEGRLAQVFVNLIDNAISFSPEGGTVRVRVRQTGAEAIIAVEDDGPGIPDENLGSVFQRFYSNRPEGAFGDHSGLGLSISRQIVEAHGGRIHAENIGPRNDPRRGARFVVALRL